LAYGKVDAGYGVDNLHAADFFSTLIITQDISKRCRANKQRVLLKLVFTGRNLMLNQS
jgi:hypothetical protein